MRGISGEQGVATLTESNPVVVKSAGGFSGRVLADWRERFITANDAEFVEWIAAAAKGGATGPRAWDGYAITAVSDAALRAADGGEAVEVALAERPALHG
jgi:myo-inositol 2-dehydrogenase/D-chiro-inositol 1-dehydrogenase